MHDTYLADEKARMWRNSIQAAGIEPEALGHYLGFTSSQMQGIWRGETTITPEMELRIMAVLNEIENHRRCHTSIECRSIRKQKNEIENH